MRGAAALLCVMAAGAAACNSAPTERIFGMTAAELEAEKLAYASDYISFVGQDDQGMVAFALDTNRGRDGDTWQAEHFAVLYDKRRGWQPVVGNGPYPNDAKALINIPDSEAFAFFGTTREGLRIQSHSNQLDVEISPVKTYIDRRKGLAEYRVGAAPAVLSWQGRLVEGRVIHEYLFLPAFNRLSRRYAGTFDDFQGIYAAVDGIGDLYLHRQKGRALAPLTGREDGFLVLDGAGGKLEAIEIEVTARAFALGFYRWPTAWRGRLSLHGKDYTLELLLNKKHNIANWVMGGFAMGVVNGALTSAEESRSVYGLGELIM